MSDASIEASGRNVKGLKADRKSRGESTSNRGGAGIKIDGLKRKYAGN
jgi:hypothetical protein